MADARTAYVVQPDDGPGSGVLVLHSWWGLTRSVKRVVESLADAGYTALAPDLLGGATPDDADEARATLGAVDVDEMVGIVASSVLHLRAHARDPVAPVAIVGFSTGASLALWFATRHPDMVSAVVAYYGTTQHFDFDDLSAPVLGHFAEIDELVSEDDLTEMHARLLLSEKSIQVHRYAGTGHWFAEEGRPDAHDPDAAALAWQRTISFLADHAPG